MSPDQIEQRVEPFVRKLRRRRPETPIVLVEDWTYANAFLVTYLQQANIERRATYRAAYKRLRDARIPGLHYIRGEELLARALRRPWRRASRKPALPTPPCSRIFRLVQPAFICPDPRSSV